MEALVFYVGRNFVFHFCFIYILFYLCHHVFSPSSFYTGLKKVPHQINCYGMLPSSVFYWRWIFNQSTKYQMYMI